MNEMTVAERLKLIEQNRVQKKEELSKAARPLIDFIRKYGTPYTTIVVSGMAAEILECEMVYKCEDEWDQQGKSEKMNNDDWKKMGQGAGCLLQVILAFVLFCCIIGYIQTNNVPAWAIVIIVLLILK